LWIAQLISFHSIIAISIPIIKPKIVIKVDTGKIKSMADK
jgi:hypothetical protein